MDDYAACDATELAARVRRGEISAKELCETAISAIERVNPELNAVVHRMYDEARGQARGPLSDGPLAGVPVVVKDFDGLVAGVPFTAGSRFLEGFVPDHDSEAIARLRRAGPLLLAKTNCPELALLGTTEPLWRGPTRNPWNPGRSTGGSSGGTAALVAARAVPLGHGGDGGGSLRIPGSHCGLCGLKATRGRIPLGPDWGEGWGGYVQWGGLTRSVRDSALLLDVLAGPMAGDPYAAPPLPRPLCEEVGADPGKLRIAYYTGALFGDTVAPEIAAAVERTAARLQALGHEVEPATPAIDKQALISAYFTEVAVGTASEIDEMERWTRRAAGPEWFEPATWFLGQVGRALRAVDYLHAREAVQAAGRVTGAFHERYDVFLTASVAHPPTRIGEQSLGAFERAGLLTLRVAPVAAVLRRVLEMLGTSFLARTPNTQLFNQTGQPAISLPLDQTGDGLPIGMQFAAALGREDLLIRLAAQLEAAHPWIERRPPVCAS